MSENEVRIESCPNCGESALPASGRPGGFVTEDIEFSMPAHCLTCRWQGPEPVPLVGGGQGRTPAENEDTGNALVGLCKWTLALVVATALIWGAVQLLREDTPPRNPPFSELPR